MTAARGREHADSEFVWLRRVTSLPIAAATGIGALAMLVEYGGSRPAALAVLLLAGTGLSTVRVVASSRGLTVGLGPWGWPAYHIPVTRITGARVEQTRALAFGGWGWRWRPGATRLIMRRGPSLVVDLAGKGSFGVTTPDAARAARLLNAALP
jgi:hypothetical protein